MRTENGTLLAYYRRRFSDAIALALFAAYLLPQGVLPLSWPAVAAVALFGAAVVFNDYLYTFTLVSGHENMTLMADVGSNLLDIDDPGPTFAEILLGLGPVAFTCALFADAFGKGLGAGVID